MTINIPKCLSPQHHRAECECGWRQIPTPAPDATPADVRALLAEIESLREHRDALLERQASDAKCHARSLKEQMEVCDQLRKELAKPDGAYARLDGMRRAIEDAINEGGRVVGPAVFRLHLLVSALTGADFAEAIELINSLAKVADAANGIKGERDAALAEVAALRAALQPFAALGVRFDPLNPQGERDECPLPNSEPLTLGDLRKAAALLGTPGAGQLAVPMGGGK